MDNIKINPGNDELRKFVEDVIASEYAKHGQVSTAKVYVYDTEIKIWFNTEKPYLGAAFWDMLNHVAENIADRMQEEGFEESGKEYLYDFRVWTFKKRLPEEEFKEAE